MYSTYKNLNLSRTPVWPTHKAYRQRCHLVLFLIMLGLTSRTQMIRSLKPHRLVCASLPTPVTELRYWLAFKRREGIKYCIALQRIVSGALNNYGGATVQ